MWQRVFVLIPGAFNSSVDNTLRKRYRHKASGSVVRAFDRGPKRLTRLDGLTRPTPCESMKRKVRLPSTHTL